MADRPFGFGLPDKPEDQGGQGSGSGSGGPAGGGPGQPGGFPGAGGPFGAMGDPQQFADALRQFADMLSWRGGPVNWDLAKNVARHAIVAAGDPSVLDAQRREITDAVRLADLWLDEAASFPSGIHKIEAWSRSEWLEATFPVWAKLCDPIAAKGVEAMSGMFTADPAQLGAEVPEELRQALGALGGGGGLGGLAAMMRQLGGAMIGSQTGTAVGELAREVIGSADIGLPLGPEGTAALLPAGVAEFGQGLSVDAGEVRLFLALREAAHQRLFAHVPWLRAHLLGAVEQYASGITVDMARLQEAIPDVDITNPEALQEALSGEGLFRPEDTPAQKAALSRLETALALVEGWVATVVSAAPGSVSRTPTRWPRRSGGAGLPADPRSGRSPPWSAWNCARAGCARRRPSGRASPRPGESTGGTRCGPTRTCCPRPMTWRIPTRSCMVSPNWTSRTSRTTGQRHRQRLTRDYHCAKPAAH